jgi:predicted metal-dependent hydrolase
VLPASAPEALKRDIALFNSQEGRHYKLHQTFNELLHSDGYPIERKESKIEADYNRFRRDRGLKFGVAYCEGFETFGPMLSSFFFDSAADYLADWDEPTTFLWLWHTGEEFEHRHVVNYTYKELYGGYWYRIYGLWFAAVHLFAHALTLAPTLIRDDLEKGRITGKWRSRARYARFLSGLVKHVLPQFIRAHYPSYDPHELPAPSNMLEFLEKVKHRYNAREIPDDVDN